MFLNRPIRSRTHRPPVKTVPRPSRWNTAVLRLEPLDERIVPSLVVSGTYPVGGNDIVTADFNGDGRLDLATAGSGGTVSVLAGDADGTFQPAISSAAGNSPTSLAVGDFNADGKLDLVTARSDYATADVRILLGNGDGSFRSPVQIDPGLRPEYAGSLVGNSLAVGDFNADGKLDLGVLSSYVAWDYWGRQALDERTVAVLLGTGTGTFAAPLRSYIGGSGDSPPAVADFNGDGRLDIASVSDYGNINVALGDGAGTFGNLTVYSNGNYYSSYPTFVVAADVNNDDRADLVVIGGTWSDSADVLLGDGLGSFGSRRSYFVGSQPNSLQVGDFNGDGAIDLISSSTYAAGGTVSVLLGTGTGAFQTPVTDTVSSPSRVTVGDFNGDGLPDAATISGSSAVSVLLNDGSWPAVSQSVLSINNATVTEANTGTVNATFTVALSVASSQTVTVRYHTVDDSAWAAGGDYQARNELLTFAPGETTKAVTVPVNGDRLGERNETFWVILSSPTNAILPDGTRGLGTIVDDEPTVSINHVLGIDPLTVIEGDSGTVPAVFTVTLSAPSDQEITVDYYTSTGHVNDIISTSGTLRFLPGVTSQTITVPVVGDLIDEPLEAFNVNLTNSPGAYIVSGAGYCYIQDNDPTPTLAINDVRKKEGRSGTTLFVFTVTLSAPSASPVTVQYATADGTARAGEDYEARSGTLTFAPGETRKTITITVRGDRTKEFDETFALNLNGAINASILDGTGFGTILNDD